MRRLFALAAIALAPAIATACSCPAITLEAALDAATNVFVARVTSVRAVPPPAPPAEMKWEDTLVQHARFTVVETYKGRPARIAELRSGYGHGDCGVALVVGMDYLVLVENDGIVNYCSGFFGPHFGWGEKPNSVSERSRMLDGFAASIRQHYLTKSKVSRPPPAQLGIEDDSSRWFAPSEEETDPAGADCRQQH